MWCVRKRYQAGCAGQTEKNQLKFMSHGHSIEVTRNSSGDEIANVNFLCDDIVLTLKIQ